MSPVIQADSSTIADIRQRWQGRKHVGHSKPTCRAYIRTGRMERRFRNVGADEVYAVVPGIAGARIWQGKWVAKDDFMPLPNIKEVAIDQNFDENGVAQATITIDNIGMTPVTGVSGLYHMMQRGYYAPFRGFKPPNRPQVGEENEWFDKLHDKSSQIIVLMGYGESVVPVFLGLINDVNLTSRPDQAVLTCRDMAQYLTDQPVFIRAKVPNVPDPITFADRGDSENTEQVGHGAKASSHDKQHPPRFVLDSKKKTEWQSQGNDTPDAVEWVEVDLPGGRYENILLNSRYQAQEFYIAIFARDKGAPGGGGARRRFDEPMPEGWIDEGRGTIPGTDIPYIKHIERGKMKNTSYSFPLYGYVLGDNSKLRVFVTNLDHGYHGRKKTKDYRAGIQELHAIRRRTKKQAKREKWILVDDLSDVVKTVFQWAGINDWEVESTGVKLKDKAVFNRGNFLMDIINNAAEQVGYVFAMQPPDSFDEDNLGPEHNLSTGVGIFRQSQAMLKRPRGYVELVHEDQVLKGIDVKLSDEPLAQNIRVRGKEASKKKGGRVAGGDHTRRWTYVYVPPWARDSHTKAIGGRDFGNSNQWRNANVKKYVVHHDQRLRSLDECKIAALFIAFREALESAQVQIEAPCMPTIYLDHQTGLYDTGTGLSTRFYVAQRGLRWTGGENGAFLMSLGGSLLDFPDIVTVRRELVKALDDEGYNPGLSGYDRHTHGHIYRNN